MNSFRILAFITSIAGLTAASLPGAESTPTTAASAALRTRYKVAVCDWMILKRQKLGAFQLTKDIGADGVEVDMGSLGTNVTFVSALSNDAQCRLDGRAVVLPEFASVLAQARGENLPEPPAVKSPKS